MNSKLKKLLEAEFRLIDAELEDEKNRIHKESKVFEPIEFLVEKIKLAEVKAKRRKEVLEAKLAADTTKQVQKQWYVYDYSDKTFQISGKGSINFKTKDGKNYQSTLFEIILTYWEQDDKKPTKIPKSEIISEISKRINEDWTKDNLKNNLRHLYDKLQTNIKIARLILFERHNREYALFDIRNPFK